MGTTLSSVPALAARIAGAHDVALGAYILGRGPVREALIDAARRGAYVNVVLPRAPWPDPDGDCRRTNACAARALRAAGAHVRLLGPDPHTTFHLKAAVCDGIAYLDDRNWTRSGRELVVADDDPPAVALVRAALRGRGGAVDGLATRKDDAQRLELDLIASAGSAPVTVETETIGAGPLTAALAHHAAAGAATTLIVSGEASAHAGALLAQLRQAGVTVRTGGANEKLALVGERAWIGSANATFAGKAYGEQLDWGTVTADVPRVAAVKTALARDVGRSASVSARWAVAALRSALRPALGGGGAAASRADACAGPA